MTRWSSTLMNAVPRLVLASPAHRLMSGRYATLHLTGRRSGTKYNIPIAYRADPVRPGRLLISTDSGWWRNIADGQPFTLTFEGRRRSARASVVSGDEAIDALRALITVPGYAKAADIVRTNGVVTEHALAQAAQERRVLAIDLGADR